MAKCQFFREICPVTWGKPPQLQRGGSDGGFVSGRFASLPSKKLAIAAIVVGSVAFVVLAGIGVSGLLNSSGIITAFPSSFSWIASIGTIGHGVMTGGAALALVLLAIGSRNCHQARLANKESDEEAGDVDFVNARAAERPLHVPVVVLWHNLSHKVHGAYRDLKRDTFVIQRDEDGGAEHLQVVANLRFGGLSVFRFDDTQKADVLRSLQSQGLTQHATDVDL